MTTNTLYPSSINAFSQVPQLSDPSIDQVIVLSIEQLQTIIEKAIQPLQDRISALEATVASLEAKHVTFETTEEHDVNRLCLDICQDRQRISKLEQRPTAAQPPALPPGDKIAARIAKLKDFLKARGGGATFQECERLLDIHPNQMTKLVSQLDKRSFEVFTRAGDDRQRVLRLKAQIVSRGFK